MKEKDLNLKHNTKGFSYIEAGLEAEGHTPIYKMHKYFARRPHNIFRNLVESYSKPGDIILDCFCGGGVTLVEGLATGRKVIAVDSNPLATFITDCETTQISIEKYEATLAEIYEKFRLIIEDFYTTTDRKTGEKVNVRWYELAYRVKCDNCKKESLLTNDRKARRDGKSTNGKYTCSHCKKIITAVSANRVGYNVVSVTYNSKGKRVTVSPVQVDEKTLAFFEGDKFDSLIKKYKLWFPQNKIPTEWDRQQEDCLHRKSIERFSDFYTKRALFSNALLLKIVHGYKGKVDPELYKILLFTFSAVIRYTNNMTVSAGNWMDGRPVAWAKHAFWIPNQFVEVNPLEYLRMRGDAIVSGMRYQQSIISKSKRVDRYAQLSQGNGTHIIWSQSAEKMHLPDSSIDAVITDPPYGSNVQYGELSHYWLVWLQKDLNLDKSLFSLKSEVLVNRKSKLKGYDEYEKGMLMIFQECFRVLKPSGILTFTFNNKDLRAWYAVINAAIKAGFSLEPDGVIYQDAIENYKNTAHTRFAGTVHGDFIYSFRKQPLRKIRNERSVSRDELVTTIRNYLETNNSATTSELYMVCIQQLIPSMVYQAQNGKNKFSWKGESLDLTDLDKLLNNYLIFDQRKKTWKI